MRPAGSVVTIPDAMLRTIEPFPTPDLVPYDAAMLSGFVVEHYQVVLFDAAERSIQQMRATLEAMCAQQVPGDTHRNLEISPTFSDRTFKHVLLPVWLLTYTFRATPYQVLVNGYTGKMDGTYPISRKLFFYWVDSASPELKTFVQWCISPEGQKFVSDVGYFPLVDAPAQ